MKKIVCGILAGCLVLATATGCQKNASGKTPITLNEVAHSIFYAPQYAAIELGYFDEEGLDVTLVNGGGADKVMTALVSGEADIGFMGSEASVYTYANGEADYAVNFAQLTQRAGNFLVGREPEPDFQWENLKGKKVLGGRAGGMPQMVFEYILKKERHRPEDRSFHRPEHKLRPHCRCLYQQRRRLHRGVRALRHRPGAGRKRPCGGLPGRKLRLCALHGILCKEKLY